MSDPADLELALIANSAKAFLAGNAGPARARGRQPAPGESSCWRGMAELGWIGIAIPASSGGLELGAAAACVVAQEAGAGLLSLPLTTAVSAAGLLAASGDRAAAEALTGLVEGRQHIAIATVAADGSVIAPDSHGASAVLVPTSDGEAFELRIVGIDGATWDECVDGSRLARLRIDAASWADAPRVLQGAAGQRAWREALDLLRLTDAAYLCGLMAAALAMGLDYLRLRHQFGVPIGSFQALQHRAADCHIQLASARALVNEAAAALGTSKGSFAAAAGICRAKAAALHVAKENIQFHGAIGFADEHDAGLYLRRAMVVAARHHDALSTLRACGSVA